MVGYWRKANHIHKWFVDNVQDGEDDCREYDVSIEQLHELRNICFDILSKLHGMEIRVPKKGVKEFVEANDKFYKGKSIQRIKNDKILAEDRKNNTQTATYFDYYYQASW